MSSSHEIGHLGQRPTRSVSPGRTGLMLALCFAFALVPVLSTTMPPVMDLPNHLARVGLIAGAATDPSLVGAYSIDFGKAAGNIGVDVLAAALARVLPLLVVNKVLVALMVLGPALGGLALNRALAGSFHILQISFLALSWSTTVIAGFVNFQISLGAALFCAAIAVSRLKGSQVATGCIHLISSMVLLLIHPLGVFLYAVAITALLIGPNLQRTITLKQATGFALRLGGLGAAMATALVCKSLLFPGDFRAARAALPRPLWGDLANTFSPIHALTILFSPVLSYNLAADVLTSLPAAALLVYALVKGYVRVHAGLALAAAGLFVLSPFAPDAFGDGSWLPQRFPIMSGLLFLAALGPSGTGDELSRGWPLKALALLTMSRTAWIAWVWLARQSDVASFDDAIRLIAPGSSVITLQQEFADWRQAPVGRFMIGSPNGVRATRRHLGGLIVVDRHAFIPTLFAVPGQHCLVVSEAWRNKAVNASSIPYPRQLGTFLPSDPYLETWRENFDYVLLLNADLPSPSSFDPAVLLHLSLIADQGFARLYRVMPRE